MWTSLEFFEAWLQLISNFQSTWSNKFKLALEAVKYHKEIRHYPFKLKFFIFCTNMRMLFSIFIHTLKLCRSHYYSEFEKVSFMLSSKAWVACEVARRIFHRNSWIFGKYVFVYIRRECNSLRRIRPSPLVPRRPLRVSSGEGWGKTAVFAVWESKVVFFLAKWNDLSTYSSPCWGSTHPLMILISKTFWHN